MLHKSVSLKVVLNEEMNRLALRFESLPHSTKFSKCLKTVLHCLYMWFSDIQAVVI